MLNNEPSADAQLPFTDREIKPPSRVVGIPMLHIIPEAAERAGKQHGGRLSAYLLQWIKQRNKWMKTVEKAGASPAMIHEAFEKSGYPMTLDAIKQALVKSERTKPKTAKTAMTNRRSPLEIPASDAKLSLAEVLADAPMLPDGVAVSDPSGRPTNEFNAWANKLRTPWMFRAMAKGATKKEIVEAAFVKNYLMSDDSYRRVSYAYRDKTNPIPDPMKTPSEPKQRKSVARLAEDRGIVARTPQPSAVSAPTTTSPESTMDPASGLQMLTLLGNAFETGMRQLAPTLMDLASVDLSDEPELPVGVLGLGRMIEGANSFMERSCNALAKKYVRQLYDNATPEEVAMWKSKASKHDVVDDAFKKEFGAYSIEDIRRWQRNCARYEKMMAVD